MSRRRDRECRSPDRWQHPVPGRSELGECDRARRPPHSLIVTSGTSPLRSLPTHGPERRSDRRSSSGGANECVTKPIAATDRLDALQALALAGARFAS